MSQHLGTTNFLGTPTVNGVDVLLNGGGVPIIQSGTAVPAAGTAGRWFLNTTTNILYRDTGAVMVPIMPSLLQVLEGPISSASSNNQIAYDNTTPTSAEGLQGWARTVTPLLANSTLIVTTTSFYTMNTAQDVYASGAHFSGTTCIGAQLLGFTTNSGNGQSFTMMSSVVSGSTAARTLSFRIGPNSNNTLFLASGTGGQAYGSATNSGRYIIMEIAP